MRVGINATILDAAPSGLGNYTIEMVNQLASLLDDYVVFASCFERLDTPSGRRYPVSARLSPSLGRRGHLARWGWLQFRLPQIVRRQSADLLLSTVPEGIVAPKVRQVIVVHDLSPLVFAGMYPRLHVYYRHVLPRLLRDSSLVICVSEFTKQEIMKYYHVDEHKLKVIHASSSLAAQPGGDGGRVRRRYGLQRFLLCVASELSPRKNLGFLLTSLAPLLRGTGVGMVMVGKRDPRSYPALLATIEQVGLAGLVRIPGYVPDRDLADLYAAADLFVFSSIYEGFGMPILEAMSSGTPVVTFNVSSMPEVAGGAAALVPLDEPEALADAVRRILEDPTHAASLVERGLQRAREFSWERSARQLYQLLGDL